MKLFFKIQFRCNLFLCLPYLHLFIAAAIYFIYLLYIFVPSNLLGECITRCLYAVRLHVIYLSSLQL